MKAEEFKKQLMETQNKIYEEMQSFVAQMREKDPPLDENVLRDLYIVNYLASLELRLDTLLKTIIKQNIK